MGSRGPVSPKRIQKAATAAGKKPRPLPDDHASIFRRIVRDAPNLAAADSAMVEQAAMAHWLTKKAFRALQDEGLVETDTTHGNGEEIRKNPNVITFKSASERFHAAATQLGLSPMARARMPLDEAEQMTLAEILFADVVTEVESDRE